MPFLIMKNKENAPDLVQLRVPLSAASLLWFLLRPFFALQPFCNDPRTLSFPSGLHLAVHPALLCCSDSFRPVLLRFLCSLTAAADWQPQSPWVSLCCCSPQLCPSRSSPVVAYFPVVLPYKGNCIPSWMNLNPWVFTEILFLNDMPITC